MARQKGSFELAGTLEILADSAVDARTIVATKADLTAAASYDYKYVGMIVSVQSEGKAYMLTAYDHTDPANWKEVGGDAFPSGGTTGQALIKKSATDGDVEWKGVVLSSEKGAASGVAELDLNGKVPSSQLPSYVDDTDEGYLNADDGKFYKELSFTTEITGETGKIYVALDTNKTYRWSGSTFVEISESLALGETSSTAYAGNKGKKNADDIAEIQNLLSSIQSSISSVEADATAATSAHAVDDLITVNGVLYKVTSAIAIGDAITPGTNVTATTIKEEIQNVVSSGGGGSLAAILNVSKSTGGIESGTSYAAGTAFETLWRDLLDPIAYPTLTAPSATLTATGAKLLEVGATLAATMTVAFNRGSISPAYGTSGFRSGEAVDYSLNSGTAQASNTFNVTVSEAEKTYQASVSYAAGEQPKDSKGSNYSTPLAGGSVNSNTITYEFVHALWANTSSAATISKQALVSKSAKQKEFAFPATTATDVETFDVPASWNVTAVEVLNTLSNTWENAAAQFAITSTTHNDAAGSSVNYNRYSCNLGYSLGARKIRVKWS